MNPEQYHLFQPRQRVWKVVADSIPIVGGGSMKTIVSTTDEDFTSDSKTEISYYTEEIRYHPMAAKKEFLKSCMEFTQQIIDNDEEFIEPEKWKVKQVNHTEDSVVRRFTDVPLPYFWKLWRRPLEPANIFFRNAGDGSGRLLFSYHEENDPLMRMSFLVYLDWKGLYDDIVDLEYEEQTIMPWIHTHCEGRLYLFSDFDTIFEDPVDEVRYLADM